MYTVVPTDERMGLRAKPEGGWWGGGVPPRRKGLHETVTTPKKGAATPKKGAQTMKIVRGEGKVCRTNPKKGSLPQNSPAEIRGWVEEARSRTRNRQGAEKDDIFVKSGGRWVGRCGGRPARIVESGPAGQAGSTRG